MADQGERQEYIKRAERAFTDREVAAAEDMLSFPPSCPNDIPWREAVCTALPMLRRHNVSEAHWEMLGIWERQAARRSHTDPIVKRIRRATEEVRAAAERWEKERAALERRLWWACTIEFDSGGAGGTMTIEHPDRTILGGLVAEQIEHLEQAGFVVRRREAGSWDGAYPLEIAEERAEHHAALANGGDLRPFVGFGG